MKAKYACGSSEHTLARRRFLGAVGTGAVVGGLGYLAQPALAAKLKKDQMRVMVIYMSGGLCQLESWDPKPKTTTGGPFRAIPTSVTGVHISELLPMTAKNMHRLALVRSLNTKNNDHGKGSYQMQYGRNRSPAQQFPHLGAVCAKALAAPSSGLPGHIRVSSGGSGGRGSDSAYLGPKFASITLGNGKAPQNTDRPKDLTVTADQIRNDFRRRANERFLSRRRSAQTDAYTYNYEQALKLMSQKHVFDMSKEPAKLQARYGKHAIGQHMLRARRLLEHGVTFVQVSHSNYDTHNENFNFHLEQLGEFDRAYSALIEDLADRGMLGSTLVVVMSEFGRTPRINQYYGRDHWGNAWSICLGGGKIKPGAVIGKTNKTGTKVTDREVNHGHLFHTYLQGVGLDSTDNFNVGGRPMPMADPSVEGIKELIV
ncbi:MAG: DUF1501 domain-containing protein [Planctomycetaceae bacterium]